MEGKIGEGFQKRKKVNLKIKQDFQIWLFLRIMGTILLTISIASVLAYLYSRGVIDAEVLSFKIEVRQLSEVMLPVLVAGSLTSLIAGLLLALFLPQKIAGPIYRIEQDILQVGTGNLTKTITLRKNDILKDFAASVNISVADIGNMVKDAKASGNVLETKIIEGKLDEINKAFEFHKNQLERIITK